MRDFAQPIGDAVVTQHLKPFAITVGPTVSDGQRNDVIHRQRIAEFLFDTFVLRIVGKVPIFVGVSAMVVEFFASVAIANVAEVLTSGGVIVVLPCGDRRGVAFCLGIVQLSEKTRSIQTFHGRQLAEFEQGRVDVDQADGSTAFVSPMDCVR